MELCNSLHPIFTISVTSELIREMGPTNGCVGAVYNTQSEMGKSNLGTRAVCRASCNTILFVEWGVFLKWHSVSGQQSSSCAYLCIQGGCSVIKAHWCSCVWTGRLQFDQWLEGPSSQQNGGKELGKIPVEFFKEGGGCCVKYCWAQAWTRVSEEVLCYVHIGV